MAPRGGGKIAHRGRGGGGRGRGGGGGAGRGAAGTGVPAHHVARPAVRDLPASLIAEPHSQGIPSLLSSAFPEFKKQQCFFSALEQLRPEMATNPDFKQHCWFGVDASQLVGIQRPDEDTSGFSATLSLRDEGSKKVFVKRIHLLDPMCAMEGDYVLPDDGALPAPSEPWRTALTKLNDPLNEAYVDAIFAGVASRLVESGISPHWCHMYGTFSARAEKYTYNVSEEYDSLRHKPWFKRNLRKGLFQIREVSDGDSVGSGDAKPSRLLLGEGEDLAADDFEDLDILPAAIPVADDLVTATVTATGEEPEVVDDNTTPVQLTAPKVRLQRMADSSSDEDERSSSVSNDDDDESDDSDEDDDDDDEDDDEDDDSEEEDEVYAEFSNFPVQVTLLEKADGTLDELLDDEDDFMEAALLSENEDAVKNAGVEKEAHWKAWLFQIIAALCEAQHYFGFVHNDLHTNNVMWSSTTETHLYYRVHKGRETHMMKVPTYGKIMKIIDFGRASFTLPDPAGFFISDAFYPGNDAGTQYNCEPFYDASEGKKVEPNPSFDLCRLAVSLLESLFPERPAARTPIRTMSREGAKLYTETISDVYNLLWEWLQDDHGKNMLRKPDGEERYPDFDLYRAIATDVHRAVPARQIEKALFASYRVGGSAATSASSASSAERKIYDLHI